jgi:hypothetical protein
MQFPGPSGPIPVQKKKPLSLSSAQGGAAHHGNSGLGSVRAPSAPRGVLIWLPSDLWRKLGSGPAVGMDAGRRAGSGKDGDSCIDHVSAGYARGASVRRCVS